MTRMSKLISAHVAESGLETVFNSIPSRYQKKPSNPNIFSIPKLKVQEAYGKNLKIATFTTSKNQYDAIKNINKSLADLDIKVFNVKSCDYRTSVEGSYKTAPRLMPMMHAIFHLMLSCKDILRLKLNKGESIKEYIFMIKWYVAIHQVLSNKKLDALIISNDHLARQRIATLVAYDLNIKSIYIQHASVSKYFPHLNFDVALLDSKASHDSYKNSISKAKNLGKKPSSECRVYLTGSSKKIAPVTKVGQFIGLALNPATDRKELNKILERLSIEKLQTLVRFHPSQSEEDIIEIMHTANNKMVKFDVSGSVEDFFNSCYCIVAGNSSIILEAKLANLEAIYYSNLDKIEYDYYGYCAHGLAKSVENLDKLEALIRKSQEQTRQIDINALQYFSATHSTQWEGNEAEYAAKTIQDFLTSQDLTVRSIS